VVEYVVIMLHWQVERIQPRWTLLQVGDENEKFDGGGRYEDEGCWRILWGEKIEFVALYPIVLFWSEGEVGRVRYSQKPTLWSERRRLITYSISISLPCPFIPPGLRGESHMAPKSVNRTGCNELRKQIKRMYN